MPIAAMLVARGWESFMDMDQFFYKEILDSLNDGIYFVNRRREVLYWNEAAERLSGYSAEEMIGKRCADNTLNHVDENGKNLCRKGCPLAGCMRDGEGREIHVFMHHKDGHRVPVSIRSLPMRGEGGKIIGSVEIFSDRSKNMEVNSEVEALRLATVTDPLTGIGNRRQADISLSTLGNAWLEKQVPFGVLYVDIDNFKSINDTWGHEVGDKVIKTVASTLAATLRPTDIACRWGGDEFVILLPNASHEGLEAVGSRLVHLVRESWLDLNGERLTFTASLGGAVAQKGECPREILARADDQLYLSKEAGRNCFHCAEPLSIAS